MPQIGTFAIVGDKLLEVRHSGDDWQWFVSSSRTGVAEMEGTAASLEKGQVDAASAVGLKSKVEWKRIPAAG